MATVWLVSVDRRDRVQKSTKIFDLSMMVILFLMRLISLGISWCLASGWFACCGGFFVALAVVFIWLIVELVVGIFLLGCFLEGIFTRKEQEEEEEKNISRKEVLAFVLLVLLLLV